MNKIEKNKAEIERLKNELIQEVEKGYKSEFDEGRISAFEDMIVYINSLEEEPVSNDLEEAACEYDNSHIDDNNLAFKAGAQWQKKESSAWSDGDEVLLSSVINSLLIFEDSGASKMKIDWLKHIRKRIKGE